MSIYTIRPLVRRDPRLEVVGSNREGQNCYDRKRRSFDQTVLEQENF